MSVSESEGGGRAKVASEFSTLAILGAGGCGSFYAIVIASSKFNGKPTVNAHRLVNEALKEVIAGIHGLQVSQDWQNGKGTCLLNHHTVPRCL